MKLESQIGQDKFVLEQLDNKKNGFFIDVGSGHPVKINNTVVLEKDYGWSGLSFDYGPPYAYGLKDVSMEEFLEVWYSNRDTKVITGDAKKHNFKKLFKENNVPKIVDYLSLDLEPPILTFEVLKLIPFDEYEFRVITFEHDFYREKTTIEPSRELLKSYGYELIKNVKNQEDWYIKKI